jgi:hypothetical protein
LFTAGSGTLAYVNSSGGGGGGGGDYDDDDTNYDLVKINRTVM